MQRFLALVSLSTTLSTYAAPSLTLSASSLPSDFNGKLAHTITGLTPGDTVLIERIADLNSNGIADAGESSVRSFYVTDGAQTIIGGIRNQNVPADEDAVANGVIDLRLDFGGVSPILNRQPGKYIIRVTAPGGNVSAPFEITAPNLPQHFTGTVKNGATSLPLSYATIVVLVGDGSPVGSVRTDADGVYNFYGPPGDYGFVVFADGLYHSFQNATLTANQVVTRDFFLSPASIRVSGRVADAASNNVPLPTVFVLAEADNGILSGALTDINGNYAFSIPSGQFKVHPLSDFTSQLGYLSPGGIAVAPSGSSLPGLDFAAPKATALIYGIVTDSSNNDAPIANLRMSADIQSLPKFESDGRSSSTGNYFIGAIAGDWYVHPEDVALLNLRSEEHQITIAAGQAVRSDFSLGHITAHLSGKVVDARGVGIANVQIEGRINNQNTAANAQTDSGGNFDLGVWGGAWTFYIGNLVENGLISHDLTLDVADGVDQLILFTVPDPTGHITGFVQDYAQRTLGGVQVNAQATINGITYRSAALSSGITGAFSLPAINGTWNISINCQDVEKRGLACPQSQQTTVNNNDPTVTFTVPFPAGPPTIENPTLDRTGPSPVFRFTLRGDPASYEILGTPTLGTQWTVITTVTIPQGNTTTQVQLTPNTNRYFQARVQQ